MLALWLSFVHGFWILPTEPGLSVLMTRHKRTPSRNRSSKSFGGIGSLRTASIQSAISDSTYLLRSPRCLIVA